MSFNVGDMLFQLVSFIFLFGLIFAIYFFVRALVTKPRNTGSMERKLDKIIELLEKDRRE